MDQNVIQEPEGNGDQQFLASNVEMNNEIIEPNGGEFSPDLARNMKTESTEPAKE